MILFCGAAAIGKLKNAIVRENWLAGKFCAFNDFKKIKNLCAQLETAWICENESYFDLQNTVDALDLRIENNNQTLKITDFKIINGGFECKIK